MIITDKLKDILEGGEVSIKDLVTLLTNINPENPMGNVMSSSNGFAKTLFAEPAFKVESNILKTNGMVTVAVGDDVYKFNDNTVINTPSMTAGTDYAIYATKDGLVVSSNFTVPNGYTSETSRRIGGFHYQQDAINAYSIYDLKFRPQCPDPRGMVIDPSKSRFWADIYLCNTTTDALGTSAYNATIADGSSCPKIPQLLGGNGTTQFDDFSQYTATKVLAAHGKRLPFYMEFQMLAHGVPLANTTVSEPSKTTHNPAFRSMIGCEQVVRQMWQWGAENWDRGNGSSGYAWYDADTNGNGQVDCAGSTGVGASRFGGIWDDSGSLGASSSNWYDEPWSSSSFVGARGVCDHLMLV